MVNIKLLNGFNLSQQLIMKTKIFKYHLLLILVLQISGCTSFSEVKLNNEQLLANNGIKSMIVRNQDNEIVEEKTYYHNGKIKSFIDYRYDENGMRQTISEISYYTNGNMKTKTFYMYRMGVDKNGGSFLRINDNSIYQKRTIKYDIKERREEEIHIGNNGIKSYFLKSTWKDNIAMSVEYAGSKKTKTVYKDFFDDNNNNIKSIDITNRYTYLIAEHKYNSKGDEIYEKSISYKENGSISIYIEIEYSYKYNLNNQIIQKTKRMKTDQKSEFKFDYNIIYTYNKKNKLIEVNEEYVFGVINKKIKYNIRGLIKSEKTTNDKGEVTNSIDYIYYDSGLLKRKKRNNSVYTYTYIS